MNAIKRLFYAHLYILIEYFMRFKETSFQAQRKEDVLRGPGGETHAAEVFLDCVRSLEVPLAIRIEAA